ncbi:MAG: hypothetical protein GXP33_13175 [Spirochaetes bacterium]|nr:hypothetical protein [Spirochaetota bacterium]
MSSGNSLWAETVFIKKPAVFSENGESKDSVTELFLQAGKIASDLYSEYFKIVSFKKGRPEESDYSLSSTASLNGRESIITLRMNSAGGGKERNFTIFGYPADGTSLYIANAVFYLWSGFHGYLESRMGPPPVYADELPMEAIKNTVIPEMPMMLMPVDVAVKKNGNLLAAFSTICVEFDSRFRILGEPGRSLFESGNYSFAAGVAVTPGGTVFLKPALGRDIYRLNDNLPHPQKWRIGFNLYGPFTALSDGSVVAVDLQKKNAVVVMGRKRKTINLFTGPYSNIALISGGPEGNVWVYDITEKRIRIHSPEGRFLDSIIPVKDPGKGEYPVSLSVYKDGRFILYYSPGEMVCYNRLGIPLWKVSGIPDIYFNDSENLPPNAHTAVDSGRGIIYVSDQLGKRIIKFLDIGYRRDYGIKSDFERKIIALNKRITADSGLSAIEEKASMYESAEAYEMSASLREKILDKDPNNVRAYTSLEHLKTGMMSASAEKLKNEALKLLKRLGPESARLKYNMAVRLYERILASDPANSKARSDMDELKNSFIEKNKGTKEYFPLTVETFKLDNLFPSLMQYYKSHPAGSVTIKNDLNDDVSDLKVSIFIKKFMDFPQVSKETNVLKPGGRAEIELYVLFNQKVLDLEEDLNIQVNMELSYKVKGIERSFSDARVITLYRRTALRWDDSGKLASFITPNEAAVERFSHRAAAEINEKSGYLLPDKFLRAVKIYDALAGYGIKYIEDPDSPISRVLGEVRTEDTVRFPRRTLLLKSGDCDDTTALLSSLLESAGVETAIITSPGHVFMAFNSGESSRNGWMFNTDSLTAISYGGYLWIPLETTVLNKGFVSAWEAASDIYKRYEGRDKIEFLTVAAEQKKYPPISLPKSIFRAAEPDFGKIEELFKNSIKRLDLSLYREIASVYRKKLNSASGKKRASLSNRIGILHARFGRKEAAEKIFLKTIKDYPGYLSSYVNLSNIYLMGKNPAGAEKILQEALVIRPQSAVVNLQLARVYYSKSDGKQVLKYFLKAEKSAPELAERYNYLKNISGEEASAVRASAAGEKWEYLWDADIR